MSRHRHLKQTPTAVSRNRRLKPVSNRKVISGRLTTSPFRRRRRNRNCMHLNRSIQIPPPPNLLSNRKESLYTNQNRQQQLSRNRFSKRPLLLPKQALSSRRQQLIMQKLRQLEQLRVNQPQKRKPTAKTRSE